MTNWGRRYLFAVLIVILATAPACYTILRHPRIAQLDYERPDDNQCAGCHTSTEMWRFHHLPKAPVTDTPWWYEWYWNYDHASDLETVPIPERSLRTPADFDEPAPGATDSGGSTTPRVETKSTNVAPVKKTKEKGDTSAKDDADKKKRPLRGKSKKTKKDNEEKP